MTQITFKGSPLQLKGKFPQVGEKLSNLTLVANDLKEINLEAYKGNIIILSIFPSLDTPVCSEGVRRFNEEASKLVNTKILCISRDLPFAQTRFCATANIEKVQTLSAFRNPDFAYQYGVDIADGLLNGLLARAVIVADPDQRIIYTELVPEVTKKINYEQCLEAVANYAR